MSSLKIDTISTTSLNTIRSQEEIERNDYMNRNNAKMMMDLYTPFDFKRMNPIPQRVINDITINSLQWLMMGQMITDILFIIWVAWNQFKDR